MSDSFAAVLRRDYLELIESMAVGVEGKVMRCAATLIAYYRHWQEWKQSHQRTDWLYQPLRQIYRDLMGLFSIPVIRAANDLLIDLGLLLRRGNPGNKQDKTYQYNVRFDRITQLLTETFAATSFEKTDVSAAISNFSASPANTHHNIQSDQVISSNQNVIEKEELEGNQEVIGSTTQVEILTSTKEQEEVRRLITESLGEAKSPTPESLDSDEVMQVAESIDNSTAINAASEFLGKLNTEAELHKRSGSERIPRPLCIPGLDSSAHEILWKHQAQLVKLNADLNAERIQQAIVDNPQHLEDAILAFIENSASGAKTPLAATGFLYNALRQGWKPRQSHSSAGAKVQVYTPPPQMLEEYKPPTLEELVERKRLMWKTAILRPSIAAWAEATPGVVLVESGPELEQQVAPPTLSPLSIDDKDPESLARNADEPTNSNQADPVASNQAAPAAKATPTELSPHQSPAAEHFEPDSESAAAADTASASVELPTEQSPKEPPPVLLQQQRSNLRLQRVEILSSAGEWVSGYFVHRGIAVANLAGSLHRFKLFDASGSAYIFFGQIRPPADGLS